MAVPFINRIPLDTVRAMPVGEVAALPAEELALLQDDADAALAAAKNLKDWLDGAIALKYADRAAAVRAAAGKDTGTVRFTDGSVIVVSDLPKRVDWDQGQLAALVERIRTSGEDPGQYVEIAIKVPERNYTAWPDAIRQAFAPSRTVRGGKPTFRLSISNEAL